MQLSDFNDIDCSCCRRMRMIEAGLIRPASQHLDHVSIMEIAKDPIIQKKVPVDWVMRPEFTLSVPLT